ncbi:hypothetical protein QTN47_25530 [Danxiaibacter flavus]|uniref:Lipoprotein n=1 Tax=Danxiaibacter flavus TaxID=3049108 RepID=A0ABV3ZLX3_9BACT|nr:hypothetical protein QNM32_25535 [Chitinophagaceae bacterium DXS]
MTPRSYTNILTIAFCLTITLSSCGQSQAKKINHVANNITVQIDTSKTAIIALDKKGNYPFDNTFNPTSLTQNDIYDIDSLLIACVTNYNNSLDKDHKEWSIDLNKNNYRKQLIAVTNKKGEKEVWVNCFCYTWDNKNWKTNILLVADGGNCYFNFKINLATKKFYDLGVNGVA